MLADANRPLEARLMLTGLAQRGDLDPEILARAGAMLADLGDSPAAERALELLERRHRRDARTSLSVAELRAALGDARGALDELDRSKTLAGSNQAMGGSEIRVLERAGEPTRALAVAEELGARQAARRISGLLRSYDPSWSPEPNGAGHSGQPRPTPHPKRVLHLLETTLPHASTGYALRSQTILAAEMAAGFRPAVATRLGFPASRGIEHRGGVDYVDGVPHHRLVLPGLRHYTSIPLDRLLAVNVEMLNELVRVLEPGSIQAATPHLNGLLAISLRDRFGIPVVYDVRGFPEMSLAASSGTPDSELVGLRRRAETECMVRADCVITLSETMRNEILDRGVPVDKVHVVPHAVDTATFRPGPAPPELVRRYGLEGRQVIGCAATLRTTEGISTLIEAIPRILEHAPHTVCLIVGDGPAARGLRLQAEELGVGKSVIFTGPVEHERMPDLLRQIDVFVVPRPDLEVCRVVTPLKLIEAASAGCCLAVSRLPALRLDIRELPSFEPGNAEELASTIIELLKNPTLRSRIASEVREEAVSRYSMDQLQIRISEALDSARASAGVAAG
jgi:glycosyltransferase involved in cell wall biosynthesis